MAFDEIFLNAKEDVVAFVVRSEQARTILACRVTVGSGFVCEERRLLLFRAQASIVTARTFAPFESLDCE